jgi:hypothetical protein
MRTTDGGDNHPDDTPGVRRAAGVYTDALDRVIAAAEDLKRAREALARQLDRAKRPLKVIGAGGGDGEGGSDHAG